MCPSYMATREEMHSTRGRARLLFEMMQRRRAARGGWHERAPCKEALDLCLSCKGCKGMPGQRRHGDLQGRVPVALLPAAACARCRAYAFGLVDCWARLAARAPRLVNWLMRSAGLVARWSRRSPASRRERTLPAFARADVPRVVARARRCRRGRPRGRALGRHVQQPLPARDRHAPRSTCSSTPASACACRSARCAAAGRCTTTACSTRAKRQLREVLDGLRPFIARRHADRRPRAELRLGVPRRAARSCFPTTSDAQRLPQQMLHARRVPRPRTRTTGSRRSSRARRVVHGHCHHKSVLGFERGRGAAEARSASTAACSTAAAAAWPAASASKRDHYDVSIACGERVLLPAVRAGRRRHAAHRRRLQLPRADRAAHRAHARCTLAQVLALAIDGGQARQRLTITRSGSRA